MLKSGSREIRIWWPLPLASVLWVIIIWAFGFFLTAPEVEIKGPPAIEASFVELAEEIPEQKVAPAAPPSPKAPPAPKPPPKPRPQPRLGEGGTKPLKPKREKAMENREGSKERTPVQKTVPQASPETERPKDLLAYMNEARERRRAGGIFEDEPAEPEAVEREPSEEELRMANVMRNLKEPGASGIFQIIRMGPRTAQFLFRAWKKDSSVPRRELVEVDAGPGGDIQRAIVQKMIELIRQYHKGDFNWESYRLDRVVVLSARPEDSKGLEDFLIREFFGEEAAPRRR
ncbi:hypothetical protein SAMN05216412_10125 [Nitrosospira multiformis]|uniref:Protein TonB, links inner and outer membranes n=1 Tax=Nitrosospira multiformis TaxID=1231 RepID=A0A1H9Y544_9PROT|nr:hypothetical protein [Nitrosospira multiformis]SES63492.1 hypothetical protein SAMN05216412_10125 [Nitrosospira multiformis]